MYLVCLDYQVAARYSVGMRITRRVMGWMGGKARARALSPARRREIARLANKARWASKSAAERRRETEAARASSLKVRKAKASLKSRADTKVRKKRGAR